MTGMRRTHWNAVYRTKAPDAVSWYQSRPAISLELIYSAGVGRDAGVIDVGGGSSTLVDCLLDEGYQSLAVLDVSAEALALSRRRLGDRARAVQWFEADVTHFKSPRRYGLWHDRSAFHFLTDAADRRAYVDTLEHTLAPRGSVIIATFALDGPEKCSGLEVMRHDEGSLQRELGGGFELLETRRETHLTPWQTAQEFVYARFQLRVTARPGS